MKMRFKIINIVSTDLIPWFLFGNLMIWEKKKKLNLGLVVQNSPNFITYYINLSTIPIMCIYTYIKIKCKYLSVRDNLKNYRSDLIEI